MKRTFGLSPISTQYYLAWGVHLFTASGLVATFIALKAIADADWATVMWCLLAAQFIDGVDGTLARLFKVKEVLPEVSGKYIDYVIDFANYAIVPAYFLFEAELVSGFWNWVMAIVILLSSALYYGKEGMVSDDLYFVGFPVMWNMVAFFYVFVFFWPSWLYFIVAILLAAFQFVPIKFPYPSRTKRWRKPTLLITALSFIAVIAIVWRYPDRTPFWNIISIFCLLYFVFFAYVVWSKTYRHSIDQDPSKKLS
ncbi:MAG TPA: hypothetical protein PKA00_07105 [Saprospiraceae bacterium]|nr:hypothetical protein [Saprospiraceae bacterium]HMQ82657.1 hypothetical protein [Saprospiraceae bacterium]